MLFIHQIFGLIWIIFLMVFVIVLSPPIRKKMKKISLFGSLSEKRFVEKYYEGYLYILVITRYIFLFFAPIAFLSIVDFSIVSEHSLTLILGGLSLIIFVSTQLPQLMRAHILVTFKIGKKNNSPIVFESGKETFVEANLYNLGFSTYKNFIIIFYFGEDFERAIIPCNNAKYQNLSFKKKFGIQKRHGGVFFSPKDNFLSIPPQEVFVFPMYIKVPKKKIDREMHIEFYSESSWGKVVIKRRLIVQK